VLSGLFKRWAGLGESNHSLPAIPYRVECACGKELTGERGPKAITCKCPTCGTPVLIFPTSPLCQLRETIREGLRRAAEPAPAPMAAPKKAVWRKPLLAGAATLVPAIAALIVLLNSSLFQSTPPTATPPEDRYHDELAAGRRALAEPDFAAAAQHFGAARTALEQKPDAPPLEVRRLRQWERESALMADLLGESLSDVVRSAKGLGDKAWRDRYRDKAVIFDDLVHSLGGGIYRVDYQLVLPGGRGRVEIHNSPALRALKVEWPTRLIIGLRLAEVRRDVRGELVLLARPDGVVLFTEPAMFQGSSVPRDAEFIEALRRQEKLLNLNEP
jgi:hypothetical protein